MIPKKAFILVAIYMYFYIIGLGDAAITPSTTPRTKGTAAITLTTTEVIPESEVETEPETTNTTEVTPESEVETEPETANTTEGTPESEVETEPETTNTTDGSPESEVETEPETTNTTDGTPESEVETEPETTNTTDGTPESEVETEPETTNTTDGTPESEVETEPETTNTTDGTPESEVETEPEATDTTDSSVENVPEEEADSESEPFVEPEDDYFPGLENINSEWWYGTEAPESETSARRGTSKEPEQDSDGLTGDENKDNGGSETVQTLRIMVAILGTVCIILALFLIYIICKSPKHNTFEMVAQRDAKKIQDIIPERISYALLDGPLPCYTISTETKSSMVNVRTSPGEEISEAKSPIVSPERLDEKVASLEQLRVPNEPSSTDKEFIKSPSQSAVSCTESEISTQVLANKLELSTANKENDEHIADTMSASAEPSSNPAITDTSFTDAPIVKPEPSDDDAEASSSDRPTCLVDPGLSKNETKEPSADAPVARPELSNNGTEASSSDKPTCVVDPALSTNELKDPPLMNLQ